MVSCVDRGSGYCGAIYIFKRIISLPCNIFTDNIYTQDFDCILSWNIIINFKRYIIIFSHSFCGTDHLWCMQSTYKASPMLLHKSNQLTMEPWWFYHYEYIPWENKDIKEIVIFRFLGATILRTHVPYPLSRTKYSRGKNIVLAMGCLDICTLDISWSNIKIYCIQQNGPFVKLWTTVTKDIPLLRVICF